MAAAARKRQDPVSRPNDPGMAHAWYNLLNEDPDKKYCWVDMENVDSMSDYEFQGWEIVRFEPVSGVRPRISVLRLKHGEPIVLRGHVLMHIDKKRHEEIFLKGADNVSGQNSVDALEKRMNIRKTKHDPFGGLPSSYNRIPGVEVAPDEDISNNTHIEGG